jgi:oxygen-independent coproporphyrinogen-3 oxidase
MIRDAGCHQPERRHPVWPAAPDQAARISDSVQKLLTLSPDRVALYGYAHVPWMSRRQQMIPSDAMPTPEERLSLFETARSCSSGTAMEIGIDHFAKPEDGLAVR